MTKDIEALAKIGEEFVLKKLDQFVGTMEYGFELKEKYPNHPWKTGFRQFVGFYQEERTKAITLGLDVSKYDEQFSEAVKTYIEITGEKDIAGLTAKEIKIRNAIEEESPEEYIKSLREEK